MRACPTKAIRRVDKRTIKIVVPPGYDASDARYPLVLVNYGNDALRQDDNDAERAAYQAPGGEGEHKGQRPVRERQKEEGGRGEQQGEGNDPAAVIAVRQPPKDDARDG